MKHSFTSIASILLFLLISGYSTAQETCFDDTEVFSTQAQIDHFADWYPDCTQTGWHVWIWGDDITNLDGLQQLQRIGGDLEIIHCPNLTDISGLGNITSLGRNLNIQNNDLLSDLDGLNHIQSIGGTNIWIQDNENLQEISGLNGIQEGHITLSITNNPMLTTISGFNGLIRLSDLAGREVSTGHIHIAKNGKLAILSGFQQLKKIAGRLEIEECGFRNTQDHFPKLDTILTNLVYKNNEHLLSFSGFDSLRFIGNSFFLDSNDSLVTASGLSGIDTMHGPLMIQNNIQLVDFHLLDKMKCALNAVVFLGNDQLTEFQAWNDLEKVEGELQFSSNERLTGISGLSKLDSIMGNLVFFNNDSLLQPFLHDGPGYLGNDLMINFNNSIQRAAGLGRLDSIGGSLSFFRNKALQSLAGLENVVKIGGFLNIIWNDALADISALSGLDPNTVKSKDPAYKDLSIYWNPRLTDCSLEPICVLIDEPDIDMEIRQNGTGCSSLDEVTTYCMEVPKCSYLIDPVHMAGEVSVTTAISWQGVQNVDGYQLFLGTEPGDYNLVHDLDVGLTTTFQPGPLPCGKDIYVHIVPYAGELMAENCPEEYFSTESVTAFAGEDVTLCPAESTILMASGGDSYLWSPSYGLDDVHSANPVADPDSTTYYRVIVSNAHGCRDTAWVSVFVRRLSITIVDIQHYQTENPGSVSVDILNEGFPYSTSWTGPDGFSSDDEDIEGLFPGCYTLLVTDAQDGCEAEYEVCIEDLTVYRALPEIASKLDMYPNPAGGFVILKPTPGLEFPFTLNLISEDGRRVKTLSVNSPQDLPELLDVQDLTPGVYRVWVNMRGRIYQNRLVLMDN